MKTKNVVLMVTICIIVIVMVGYNYSYSKSKDSQKQDAAATAGLDDINLKVEQLSKEVEGIKTDLNALKSSGKSVSKETTGPGLKVAVVSISKIFQNCKRGARYKKEAMAEQDKMIAELDRLSKEIDADKAGLKTLKEDSSDYMARAKELFDKQASFQAQQEFYKQQMELKDKLWTKDLYQDILQTASDVAKEKGLDLVLREDEVDFSETNSNELGLAMRTQKVLYSGGCPDITDEITARLDAKK
jgi:Skp family chaperone for outer membrane proteins